MIQPIRQTPKFLCLIIDSVPHAAWQETYEVHRRIWQKCLDRHPEIDGYFLRAVPRLSSEHVIEPRCFSVRGEERFNTILFKTLRAVEVLLADHDYVIRTNLSSIYDFEMLLREDLPREALYTGHVINGHFVSGSGMILSRDVAQKLLLPVPALVLDACDDIAIWQILTAHGISMQHRPMFMYDYTRGPEQLVIGQHVHYRLRDEHDPQRALEREVTERVFAKLYRDDGPQ